MNVLDRYKWFWMTLGLWLALGIFSAWALIYSPFHLETKEVIEFSAQVNGSEQHDRILVGPAPIGTGLEAVTKEWEEEGWKPVSGKTNLVNVLLGTTKDSQGTLDHLAQLRLYGKKDRLRLLGLLASAHDGQTYYWISEMSQDALHSPDPASVVLPLGLPSNASNIATINMDGTKAVVFTVSDPFDPISLGVNQGFSCRPLPSHAGSEAYLLQKGKEKWIAASERFGGQIHVSLMQLTAH